MDPAGRGRRFVDDSPLEQLGFEPLVPPACGTVGSACMPCRSPKAPVCDPGPGVRIPFSPAASLLRTTASFLPPLVATARLRGLATGRVTARRQAGKSQALHLVRALSG